MPWTSVNTCRPGEEAAYPGDDVWHDAHAIDDNGDVLILRAASLDTRRRYPAGTWTSYTVHATDTDRPLEHYRMGPIGITSDPDLDPGEVRFVNATLITPHGTWPAQVAWHDTPPADPERGGTPELDQDICPGCGSADRGYHARTEQGACSHPWHHPRPPSTYPTRVDGQATTRPLHPPPFPLGG